MADDARLQVVLEAKIDKLIDKLSAANRAVYGASAKIQKDLDAADRRWSKMFVGDPGKAIETTFSRSRLALIDEGSAKIPVFGAALEELGPLGLGAAAGVAALFAAFEGSKAAAAFADEIGDTAERLHVTTDALQEYREATRLAGGETEGADKALESFSEKLGLAQAGLPKAKKGFQELGFTDAQIKGFGDVESALAAVAARVQGLSNVQKDAVINQLGLTGMKELISGGADEMQRLREEARKAGLVMSAELVERGGQMNDQFETLEKVISIQLKSALIDLGPAMLKLLEFGAQLAKQFGDVVDSFKSLENRQTSRLQTERSRDIDLLFKGGLNRALTNPAGKALADSVNKDVERIDAELAKRASQQSKPGVPAPAARSLIDTTTKKDNTAELTSATDQQYDAANKAALQAIAALAENIEGRAELQKQAADAEAEKVKDAADAEAAKIKADQSLGKEKRQQLLAEVESTKQLADEAAAAKKAKIDRDTEDTLIQRRLSYQATMADLMAQELQNQAGLAKTAADRRDLELRILSIRQKVAKDALDESNRQAVRSGELTSDQAAARSSALDKVQVSEIAQVLQSTQGPLERWRDANLSTAQQVKEAYQQVAVNGLESVTDGITAAILHTKSLGEAFRDVANQIISDLVRIAVQRSITQPLANMLFPSNGAGALAGIGHLLGFASGRDGGPGGLARVGEFGQEVVNLPSGSQVIPNDVLRALSKMDTSGMSARGGGDINVDLHIDASGAFGLDTLYQVAGQAVNAAVSQARLATWADAQKRQRNSY